MLHFTVMQARFMFPPGDIVSAGDVIAAVGTTGDSTGNHCHFEIRYDGGYLNPASFIGG